MEKNKETVCYGDFFKKHNALKNRSTRAITTMHIPNRI